MKSRISLGKRIESILKVGIITGGIIMVIKLFLPSSNSYKQISPVFDSVQTYEDASGKAHAVITQKEVSRQEITEYNDSLARVLKVKSKDIIAVTALAQNIDTVLDTKVTKEKGKTTAKHENTHISLESITDSTDRGTIHVSLNDTLTHTELLKRRLFSATRQIDISNSNPYVKIASGYSIKIKEEYPKVVIGPYVGYGYNFGTNRFAPSVGISVTVPIVKIK